MKACYFFLILFCSVQAIAQEHTLQLNCETPFIDKLECQVTLNNRFGTGTKLYYPAIYNADKTQCSFSFPDSVFQQMANFLVLQRDTLSTFCSFRVINKKDTTLYSLNYLMWEDVDTMTLKVKYEVQEITKIRFEKYISRKYTIKNPSSEVLLSITGLYDNLITYRNESQEECFARYKSLITEHPNSRSILKDVYFSRNFSLRQLEELRELFSTDVIQTYWGKELTAFINNQKNKFKSQCLLNSHTGEKEEIVVNPKKYTLVIFSASWCAPCHKLIPQLKALYAEKKELIDFVYISLDEPNRLEAWKKLLEEEQIPWRSLSVNSVVKTRQDYMVPAIPYAYLIYPDGKFKNVDIRLEKDKKMMEQLTL